VPDGVSAVAADELAQRADALVSIGGDGTMLGALRLVAGRPVPVLGVNLGRLGFLVEVEPDELTTALDRVEHRDFTIEEHGTVVLSAGREQLVAFNEIALMRVPGDGLVQATLVIAGRPAGRYGKPAVPPRWRTSLGSATVATCSASSHPFERSGGSRQQHKVGHKGPARGRPRRVRPFFGAAFISVPRHGTRASMKSPVGVIEAILRAPTPDDQDALEPRADPGLAEGPDRLRGLRDQRLRGDPPDPGRLGDPGPHRRQRRHRHGDGAEHLPAVHRDAARRGPCRSRLAGAHRRRRAPDPHQEVRARAVRAPVRRPRQARAGGLGGPPRPRPASGGGVAGAAQEPQTHAAAARSQGRLRRGQQRRQHRQPGRRLDADLAGWLDERDPGHDDPGRDP
jgi:hypothetical protein